MDLDNQRDLIAATAERHKLKVIPTGLIDTRVDLDMDVVTAAELAAELGVGLIYLDCVTVEPSLMAYWQGRLDGHPDASAHLAVIDGHRSEVVRLGVGWAYQGVLHGAFESADWFDSWESSAETFATEAVYVRDEAESDRRAAEIDAEIAAVRSDGRLEEWANELAGDEAFRLGRAHDKARLARRVAGGANRHVIDELLDAARRTVDERCRPEAQRLHRQGVAKKLIRSGLGITEGDLDRYLAEIELAATGSSSLFDT